MKSNTSTCITIPILIGGLIVSYVSGMRCRSQSQQLRSTLTLTQKKQYDEIVKQRIMTLIRGFVWSSVFILIMNVWILMRMKHISPKCTLQLVFWWLLLPQLYYLLQSQPHYLLDSQTDLSSKQVQVWFKTYQCYKQSMIYAFIAGCIITWVVMSMIRK